MKPDIDELTGLAKYFGGNKDFTISDNGSVSLKESDKLWITAEHLPLSDINNNNILVVSREMLDAISAKHHPADIFTGEEQLKNEILPGEIHTGELLLHHLINYKYVTHLNPAIINGLLCGRNAKKLISQLFGDKILFISYSNPGYDLFLKLRADLNNYRTKYEKDPEIIFIENYGVIAGGANPEEIKKIIAGIILRLHEIITPLSDITELPYNNTLNNVIPVIRMLLSENPGVVRSRHNTLISRYYNNQQEFHKISLPLSPDTITNCKTRYLYIEQSSSASRILESFRHQLPRFRSEYGYSPEVIVIKDMGVLAVSHSYSSAETILDVFENHIKVCHYSASCGGTKFLSPEHVDFLHEADINSKTRIELEATNFSNRIALITGGKESFSTNIAKALFNLKMNVILASQDDLTGIEFTKSDSEKADQKTYFIQADVADPESVKNLISRCISEFGGLDLLIFNPDNFNAGSILDLEHETFTKATQNSYNGYFNLVKHASEIMKLQNQENPEYFTNIIYLSSGTGNCSDPEGKGLTRTFAKELAPFKIKVNSICTGDFYDGMVWSDPHKGLFAEYLKSGTIAGARNIEDVKKYFTDRIPLKRGVRPVDILKALSYIIDQDYETGQVITVTGGQSISS